MQRILPWLSAALLGVAIYLGVAVWREVAEKTTWQQESARRAKQFADLRTKASARRTKTQTSLTNDRQAIPTRNASPPLTLAADPALTEAERIDNLTIANRGKRSFRQNALNGYITGFDALHLPPEKLTQAKEILLAGWEAAANVRKTATSPEDAAAAFTQNRREMDAQMTALLGQADYDVLKASTRLENLDWTVGTDMWDGGAPLERAQLLAIAQAEVRVEFEKANWSTAPSATQTPDPQSGLSSQDNALLAATASALSPTQQEILRRNLIEENQYNAAMRAFSEKQKRLWKAGK